MAGPGGGSRGGGGFGGGGGGRGGFGGGGFGGPRGGGFYGGPRGPRMYGWGWGPRRYYGYGGGGGCLGLLMLPIILILVVALMIFSILGGAFNAVSEGGVTEYGERQFQDFANKKYNRIYGASSAYEDNILIVFLTTEEAEQFYYIGWVGDHVKTDVNLLFGSNMTELGRAMDAHILSPYHYQLGKGLAGVVEQMQGSVLSRVGESSFICSETRNGESKLYNDSNFTVNEETVNLALASFTEQTGIPISIVIEDSEDVFETNYTGMITGILIIAVLLGVSIYLIVKARKSRKNRGGPNSGGASGGFGGNDYANGNFRL